MSLNHVLYIWLFLKAKEINHVGECYYEDMLLSENVQNYMENLLNVNQYILQFCFFFKNSRTK